MQNLPRLTVAKKYISKQITVEELKELQQNVVFKEIRKIQSFDEYVLNSMREKDYKESTDFIK